MAGRKRKQGRRLANGHLADAPRAERRNAITGIATSQPHRAWLKEKRQMDQRAESALGRMFLAHMITEAECWAGERFRTILREFHVVLASPVTVSTAAIMVSGGVENPAEADHLASERKETDEEKRERVLSQFDAAKRVLGNLEYSGQVISTLDNLLMRDVAPEYVALARVGLKALAKLWRIEEDQADEAARPVRVSGRRNGPRAEWPHEEKIVEIQYK